MQDPLVAKIAKQLMSEDLFKRVSDIYFKTIKSSPYYNQLSNDSLGKELNLSTLLDRKFHHSLAAIGLFENSLNPGQIISDDVILATILFELTQVDFADSLGELSWIRRETEQMRLFENLKRSALFNIHEDLFNWEIVPSNEQVPLKTWQEFLFSLTKQFYSLMVDSQGWQKVVNDVDTHLTNYYHCIAFEHCYSTKDKDSISKWLYARTYNDNKENLLPKTSWVISPNLWCTFFGASITFLIPIYLVSVFSVQDIPKYVKAISFAYRSIGILNVVLDDIIDIEEDIQNNDPNIPHDLEQGKFSDDLILMRSFLKSDKGNETNGLGILLASIVKQTDTDKQILEQFPAIKRFGEIKSKMFEFYYLQAKASGVRESYLNLMRTYIIK